MRGGGLRRLGERLLGHRPEHAGGKDREPGIGEDVIDAKVARAGFIAPVGGIERRIAEMLPVGAALPRCGRDTACARRLRVLQPLVCQEPLHRPPQAVAIRRVGVEAADEQDRCFGRGRASACIVRRRPAVEILPPEIDLVMVAAEIASLRPVEDRRRRIGGKKMQPASVRQGQGHVPMPARREPHRRAPLRIRPGIALGVLGEICAGKPLPPELAERPRGGFVDRQARDQRHAGMAGKLPPAPVVVPSGAPAVAVEVDQRRQAVIAGGREGLGIVDPVLALPQKVEEGRKRMVAQVLVEAGDEEDIGLESADHPGRSLHLGGAALDVAQEETGGIAAQGGVVDGDPQG